MELTEVFGSGNLCLLYTHQTIFVPSYLFYFLFFCFLACVCVCVCCHVHVRISLSRTAYRLNFPFHALFTLFEDYQASAISTSPKVCRPCSPTSMYSWQHRA
ncbi:hypothetical protein I7I53_08174 [Histoplasma capsulatum var. duboisii H88]|uniref:Uncharacterized protein n=1 Tax=Ajellomyces capsulatus (strain H88) TaxID=544711 RepID=A0A8A1LJ80_AJEC8|nr:hypothetical protein I7I53_08174 [Histoplasma capsulatum var. duboisii H88]